MAEQQTASPPKDINGLIATLDEYLVKKAPFQIPEGGKEFLVRFGPWISLVLLILLLPLLLFALGIGTLLVPFGGVGYATGFGLSAILACVQIVMIAIALPGLFARKTSGWMLLFYEHLLSIVANLLRANLFGAIIGGVIGLYILFQVREKYH
jgi:hypothetical protein